MSNYSYTHRLHSRDIYKLDMYNFFCLYSGDYVYLNMKSQNYACLRNILYITALLTFTLFTYHIRLLTLPGSVMMMIITTKLIPSI